MRNLRVILAVLVVVLFYFNAAAAQSPEAGSAQTQPTADLMIESVDFVPPPQEGSTVDSVKICVMNQGKADAQSCVLSLRCNVTGCNEGDQCDQMSRLINGEVTVPAIKSNQKACVEWKPQAPVKWISGKYYLVAEIDKYNAVPEADEANNIKKTAIFVTSLSPRPIQ